MIFTIDHLSIIMPALVVGMMILFTHIPLGQEVLKRGIIFIDLAIAQAASFGLVLAEILHLQNYLLKETIAVTAAITAGLIFRKIEKTIPQYQEAMIGAFYVMMATLSLLLLSHHPHGAEHFNSLLSGEILFVSWQDILYHLPIYIVTMLIWFNYSGSRKGLIFYIIFAILITSSVQLVGVFLVFISLIVPALMIAITKLNIISGYIVAISATIIGILISSISDYPSSSCIILSIIVCCFVMSLGKKIN